MTEDTKATPDEHSDIVGGSSAGRVLACPGSVQLNQQVKKAHKERILAQLIKDHCLSPSITLDNVEHHPKTAALLEAEYRRETTSEYAEEGTALHEAVAWVLLNDEEPESMVDRTFEGHIITGSLYEEAVVPAFDAFDDYCDQVFEEDGEDMEFLVEKRCQLPGIPGAFGTSDIIGKTSKRIVIWDWKFGAGVPVSPFENNQLRFYARAAVHSMGDWFDLPENPDKPGHLADDTRVDLIICQPRIGDGEAQVWTTTYADLEAFRWRLVRAVSEAVGDDARFNRGDHCRWCDAKHVCPAKQQLAGRILDVVDDALSHPDYADEDEPNIKEALKVAEVQFTPDDLAQWIEDARDIEAWVKWVRELAFKELQDGRAVTGYELDQGLGNAAWTVDEKTVDRRLANYGLSVDERRDVKPISPTQARKKLKALGDEKNMKLVEKIIDRPKAAAKMVPEGTAKNPVKPNAERVRELAEKLKGASGE